MAIFCVEVFYLSSAPDRRAVRLEYKIRIETRWMKTILGGYPYGKEKL